MANLRIPIYSMRSYETGIYDLTKDGNFQVHLARMNRNDWILIPENSTGIVEFIRDGVVREDRIMIGKYGMNAYETRRDFWSLNKDLDIPDCIDLITTNLTGYPGKIPIVYYLEITSHPLISRFYIDEFFQRDIDSVNKSVETQVLNEWQKTWLIKNGADPKKIILNQKVVKPSLIHGMIKKGSYSPLNPDDIFFPFRISDPCYKFDKVLNLAKYFNYRVVITDPNESFTESNSVWVHKWIPTKAEYYAALMEKPLIVYLEDPDFCFHPGLGEMIYFDCTILSPYQIPSKEDILIV